MNALTVDLEEYYQTNGFNLPVESWSRYESRVDDYTRRLLACFEEHQVKATFFIVGCVARDHPNLVKEIIRQGHEIGSHSGWHQLLYRMNKESFREDVKTSKKLLEDISGELVYQYRAPSWSLDVSRYEWLAILEEEGYRIDSSIQPFRTPLSGSNRAPVVPFRPILGENKLSIIEFPSTVFRLGNLRFPFSGGFYLRILPESVLSYLFSRINRKGAGMLYIHPWELDTDQPRISGSILHRIIQYTGLNTTERKLSELLPKFPFQPLGRLCEGLSNTDKIPFIQLT